MEDKLNKKQIISLLVGVISLVVLIFGATYAYFQVAVSDTSGTTTITGDIGGGTLGTVTLTGGDTELYLGISPYDMSESKKGTTYYSSTTEGSRETNKSAAGMATYTAALSGDESNSLLYACDYEFTITTTGTMVGKKAFGDVQVVFEGDVESSTNLKNTRTISGTWDGIKFDNGERTFNVYLQLTNTKQPQNDLAGTNLSVEIENTKFECYLDEGPTGEAYAIYTEGNQTLTFLRSETPITAGENHNGETITSVYTGIEDTEYYLDINTYDNNIPWFDTYTVIDGMPVTPIENVVFEDEIRPISTVAWFAAFMNLQNLDIEKLNMSNVASSFMMFAGVTINDDLNLDIKNMTNLEGIFWNAILNCDLSDWDVSHINNMRRAFLAAVINTDIGISEWDVSNVTDMSYMFDGAYINADLNLEKWDTSSVKDMSHMFMYTNATVDLNLSEWDVSNVLDMQSMFTTSAIPDIGDISKWNTGNVISMRGMFSTEPDNAGIYDLDLSDWDVSNVTRYDYFSDYETVISPVWENVYFSIYSETDNSIRLYSNMGSTEMPKVGDVYRGKIVTKIENLSSQIYYGVSVCNSPATSIVVEDEIRITMASRLFATCTKVNNIDVTKLDTSMVKDMSFMFASTGIDSSVTTITIKGIEELDTSSADNMSSMFDSFGKNANFKLDLSRWNVSKVLEHGGFNDDVGESATFVLPKWKISLSSFM